MSWNSSFGFESREYRGAFWLPEMNHWVRRIILSRLEMEVTAPW
jgi:hypothetical protein